MLNSFSSFILSSASVLVNSELSLTLPLDNRMSILKRGILAILLLILTTFI